jgi:tellurite resistance protein TehA-like permease
MNTELLFILANLFFLAGTILLARKVIKNRDTLKDFDLYGSTINFVGMMVMATGLMELKSYVAAIVSIPTTLFWAIVAVYSFRNRKVEND